MEANIVCLFMMIIKKIGYNNRIMLVNLIWVYFNPMFQLDCAYTFIILI